ncbi:Protein Wnt-7b-like protein [Dinothrombium tinctorium]|uniref:Protein Wnt n=1 Tax=Dinothrombium tinctorium TaxID=1965070 RepID=A0A3S3Q3P7_9ACAR|nr:Protein Wnt-7b-like protein [Dinothrombium tinctorium]
MRSKEAAFVYAITSAGVVYSISKFCRKANFSTCECDRRSNGEYGADDWDWGGCSVNVRFGMRIARKFIDSREMEDDERTMMNLHNNRAGRRAVKYTLQRSCKCHGISGSCTTKTCWKSLPDFRLVADYLMKRYVKAKKLTFLSETKKQIYNRNALMRGKRVNQFLTDPKPRDLVFIENSPNYCEVNYALGSYGTQSRLCNRSSHEIDGCDILCCGRGYNTHRIRRTKRCQCKFIWCCHVSCKTCVEEAERYSCK